MMEIQNKLWKKGRGGSKFEPAQREPHGIYIYIYILNVTCYYHFSSQENWFYSYELAFFMGEGGRKNLQKKIPALKNAEKNIPAQRAGNFFFPDHAKVRIHCMIWKFLLALCARQFKVKKLININTNCSHSCIYQRPNTHRHKNLEKVLFKHHTICLKFANCKETSEGTVINSYSVTAGSLTYTDIHNIWQFV